MSAIEILHNAFRGYLELPDTTPIDVALAAVLAVQANDPPLWMMLIAPPSSAKTEILQAMKAAPNTEFLSTLTPQTLVSGWRAEGGKGRSSLLNRLKPNAVLILKDFTTVLQLRPDSRGQILAQLREVYDGVLDASYGTGADVRWRGKIGIIAGVTPIIDTALPYEKMLGERFLSLRMVQPPSERAALRAMKNAGKEYNTKRALYEAVATFLAAPRPPIDEVQVPYRCELQLGALANFISRARTTVHRDSHSREVDALVEPEGPGRLSRQFHLLVRTLASVRGRRESSAEDMLTVQRVAWDSLMRKRFRLMEILGADEHEAPSITDLASRLRISETSVRRECEDIALVGLAEEIDKKWYLSEFAIELLGRLER